MLTSSQANGADSFIPNHHLALITQPVLGARSRLKKTTTNIIVERSTSTDDKLDSMTNTHRSLYNDSPPLILPINRVNISQYPKKNYFNIHHESSDSGIDLSLSTNSSVQFQQYSQQHISTHRPLSALNEDSTSDDGYHDEQQQTPPNPVRLRFPPVNFGRNRSMEDILYNNVDEQQQQQHRSSSFVDERQGKLFVEHEQKMKRSSDGALLDLIDLSKESIESHRRTNTFKHDLLYPSSMQQHRSLNDLTNKTSKGGLNTDNESNMSTVINNLPTTHTIIRKPNTSTLKPLRKKTKLNIIVEPSTPLTLSRLTTYDEQINTMTRAGSSSSNQTTPRSIRPLGQQQQQQQQQTKSKVTTPLSHYSNQEQIRAHVNRSVVERQHPTTLVTALRPGIIQQMVPFDASPSKSNTRLKHYLQQHQPITLFHPSLNVQMTSSRPLKQTLPTLNNEETTGNIQDEKRKLKEQMKFVKYKEQEERKHLKQKEEFENNQPYGIDAKKPGRIKNTQELIQTKFDHKRESSQDRIGHTIDQRNFIAPIHKQQTKELSFEKHPTRKFERKQSIEDDENISTNSHLHHFHQNGNIHSQRNYQDSSQRQRRSFINGLSRNSTSESFESVHLINQIGKPQDNNNNTNRRRQTVDDDIDHFQTNRSDGIDSTLNGKQHRYETKPIGSVVSTKTQTNNIHNINQTNQSDYSHVQHKKIQIIGLQTRPLNVHFPPFENSSNRNLIDQNRQINQWQKSKSRDNQHSWQKSQVDSISKPNRIQPLLSTNTNSQDLQREKETSRLSYVSKFDLIQAEEKTFKPKNIENDSTNYLHSKSPTSWSIVTEHQNDQKDSNIHEKISIHYVESSRSSSSHEEEIEDDAHTTSRTYRLNINNQQQSLDEKHVISSNGSNVLSIADPPSRTSSHHTFPFVCPSEFENSNDTVVDNSSQFTRSNNTNYVMDDIYYVLSDRESTKSSIDRPLSSKNVPSNKKFYSQPVKVIVSTEHDEISSNYDSDDGWSDDSVELLYVDERYAADKRKSYPPSHLSSQQQQQQQNMLLQ